MGSATEDMIARWRALEGDNGARLAFYAAHPSARRELLGALQEEAEPPFVFLGRLVVEHGLTPDEIGPLAWGRLASDPRCEPLWLFLFWELGASDESPVREALLRVGTQRTVASLERVIAQTRSAARRALEVLWYRIKQRRPGPAQPGPLDWLYDEPALWGWEAQWALMHRSEEGAVSVAASGIYAVRRVAEGGGPSAARARLLLAWAEGVLHQEDAAWQDAIEQCWLAAEQLDAVRVWGRQQALWGRGAALRQLPPELARRFAAQAQSPGVASREAALLGLPWSIDALAQQAQARELRPAEYAFLVAPTVAEMVVGSAHEALARATHQRLSVLVLSKCLAGVQDAARWPRALWLAMTRRDEPTLQVELCRLLARVKLEASKEWLERLVIEAADLSVVSAAMSALAVVGDARSAGIVRTRGVQTPALSGHAEAIYRHLNGDAGGMQIHGQLTLAAEHVASGGLEVMQGAHAGALTLEADASDARPAGALADPRAHWDRLCVAPRAVSADVSYAHLLYSTPAQTKWMTRVLLCWLPPIWAVWVAMMLWGLEEVRIFGWLLLALWGPALWRLMWGRVSMTHKVLERGAPVVGALYQDARSGRWYLRFKDEEGDEHSVEVPEHQRSGLVEGPCPALFLRDGTQLHVELMRCLAVGKEGQLAVSPDTTIAPRRLVREMWWLCLVTLWMLLVFEGGVR